MKTRKILWQWVGLLSISTVLHTNANASGFALIEQSASGMGNAFAGGAASAEDATTVFFNPAGMARLKNPQAVAALHFIHPVAKFKNNGSSQPAILGGGDLTGKNDDGARNAVVPNFYYVHPVNQQWTLGVGVNVPFGLTSNYDDNWVGRYHAVESDFLTININPSVSFKVNDKLSLGFGLSAQHADVTLTSAIDFGAICVASFGLNTCSTLGALPQQADGFAHLKGDNDGNMSYGWNAGLLANLDDATRVGLAYRSEIKHDIKGRADFTVPGVASFVEQSNLFLDTGLSASVTLPQSLSVSAYHELNQQLAAMADITWTGWSSFDELRITYDNPAQPDSVTTENWKDSYRFSLGVNYRINTPWMLRGGLAYDQTPIPNAERRTPRIPGNDRTWLTVGFAYTPLENLTCNVGYAHLFVDSAKSNHSLESSVPTLNATLTGTYDLSIDILSAQVAWQF